MNQTIHFGVDYYPEHWPRSRWERDAQLMHDMGIQAVRMAEFSWHKLEPVENTYQFDWLDDAINLLAQYGIQTILGTPSAAPPAWMVNRYPEILPTDRDGRVRGFGGRHHDCQSNPIYREKIRSMVTAMAKHFGTNPNVIGWQPDNELGNSHGDLCTCEHCRRRFQNWLKQKYGTVERLNTAWGCAFWSQEYDDFSQVFAPHRTVTGENPSAMLDWKRFHSDLIVDFMKWQTDILRQYTKNQFITHNYMGFADVVNYYDLGKLLDFVSHDQYPGGFYIEGEHEPNFALAANLDVVRSYKNQTFWIMEQQSGITGWEMMGRLPAPGQLSLWTLQSIAHGADVIVYFRWRVCAMGTEQYWHGILPHSGNPGRRYEELKHTVHEMTPIMEKMQGSMPKSEVGIVYSFDQNYAFQIQPHHKDLSYVKQVHLYYQALYEKHRMIDFVPEDGNFNQYKLLIAPLQYLMNPQLEQKYFDYVKAGGYLVLTMRTGVKDETNLCMTEMELPGKLGELAGIQVLDYDCLKDTSGVVHYGGREYESNIWSDLMKCGEDTKVLATYASEFYAGEPCVTEHRYGKGVCCYVGTQPGKEWMDALTAYWCERTDVEAIAESESAEVEFTKRENKQYSWIFAINHSKAEQSYQVSNEYHLIKGEKIGRLQPFEVHILEKTL